MLPTSLLVLVTATIGDPTLPLLDDALAAIASVRGILTTHEEEAAVRLVLQMDDNLLLLSKHFGTTAQFPQMLRNALAPVIGAPPTEQPAHAAAHSGCEALLLRRSVKETEYDHTRPVPEASVQRALAAAIHAPNHWLNEPWRFYVLGPATKLRAAALNPSKQEAFQRVPGWLVLTVAASEYAADGSLSTKKGLEDHAATAAAAQNFMLSLASEGVGSKWMTGALGIPPASLLELVKANATAERFMGVLFYGFPRAGTLATMTTPQRKQGVAGVVSVLE